MYTTPNVTLWAEWDIESVIVSMYKELDMLFMFMHVKSHQDDVAPTAASLSLESRLNVEADRLAAEFMKEDLTRQLIKELFLSAKAQILIKDASIHDMRYPKGHLI
jgi:hypothetical protein